MIQPKTKCEVCKKNKPTQTGATVTFEAQGGHTFWLCKPCLKEYKRRLKDIGYDSKQLKINEHAKQAKYAK